MPASTPHCAKVCLGLKSKKEKEDALPAHTWGSRAFAGGERGLGGGDAGQPGDATPAGLTSSTCAGIPTLLGDLGQAAASLSAQNRHNYGTSKMMLEGSNRTTCERGRWHLTLAVCCQSSLILVRMPFRKMSLSGPRIEDKAFYRAEGEARTAGFKG